MRFRDAETGKLQGILKRPETEIACMALSPDAALLATSGAAQQISLWQIEAPAPGADGGSEQDASIRVTLRSTFSGHTSSVFSLAFSRDGQWLASGGFDQTVRLWSVPNGAERATLDGHNGAVRSMASGGLDRSCRLWSPSGTLRAAPTFASPVIAVAFAPDTSSLAIGTYDGQILMRKARAFERPLAGPLKTIPGPTDTIMAVAISPDGRLLASDDEGHTITLRHLPSGDVVRQLPEHPARIRQLAFSPDGATLAVCLYNGQVQLRDMQTGHSRLTLSGHPEGTRRIDFSPDGTVLATAGWEGTAKLWDLATGSGNWREYRLPGEVKLWDAASGEELLRLGGQPIQQFTGHEDIVYQLACSPRRKIPRQHQQRRGADDLACRAMKRAN